MPATVIIINNCFYETIYQNLINTKRGYWRNFKMIKKLHV